MSESVLAASDFSLETSWKQAEKGTLSPFECLSFANTIQADLPTCAYLLKLKLILFYSSNIPFARNGLTNGIEMILDAEVYDYALSKSGMEGFTLSILHHLDIPIMKNIGINILPGQSNQFSTTVELMNTSRQVRDRFTPVESQCYFEGELWLKHLPASWSFRYVCIKSKICKLKMFSSQNIFVLMI